MSGTNTEADWEDALEYGMDIYKMSFNPPLASIQKARDKAVTCYEDNALMFMFSDMWKKLRQDLLDFCQTHFKEEMEKAYGRAVAKALGAFDYTTKGAKRSEKLKYTRRLKVLLREEFEGFEDLQCKRAMERGVDVYNSLVNPSSHMMSDTLKESISPVSVHEIMNVEETDCQKALDHAKDVYKSFFKPPVDLLIEPRQKALAAFNDVAVGAGGAGSIRKKYEHILRQIMYKSYQDVVKKTHEEAASKALAAFESRVGCLEQKYKRHLEDFMRNEYEGFEESESRKRMARFREMLELPLNPPTVV